MYTSSESGIYIRFYQAQVTSLSGVKFAIGLIFGRWKGHHPILICRIILEENTVDYQNVAGCISIMCSCNVTSIAIFL